MQILLALLLAVAFYRIQTILYKNNWDRELSVRVQYSKAEAVIGERLTLTETIENKKALPLPLLYVKFSSSKTFLYDDMNNSAVSDHYYRNDIFSVLGNQQVVRKQDFTTTRRGYFVIDSINLVSTDLFMRKNYAAMYDNHTGLYVYPRRLNDTPTLALISSVMGFVTRKSLYEDPLNFRGMRDYANGDPMRKINWKASAKNHRLMVNTYFDTQNAKVVLLFNIEPHVTQHSDLLAERCIEAAATLLDAFSQKGIYVKLAVNLTDPATGKLSISDFGIGTEHAHMLLRTLCRLNLNDTPSDFLEFFEGSGCLFENGGSDTIYIVLSNYRKPLLQEAYEQKKKDGYHMLFLCPEFQQGMTPAPFVTYWEVREHEI